MKTPHLIETALRFIEAQEETAFSRADFTHATGMTEENSRKFLNHLQTQGVVKQIQSKRTPQSNLWASIEAIRKLRSTHTSEESAIAQLVYNYPSQYSDASVFRIQLTDLIFTQTRGFSERYLRNTFENINFPLEDKTN